VVDISEKVREARLRWYGHVIRIYEVLQESWRNEMKRSEDVRW
jgi:hypothetical protein